MNINGQTKIYRKDFNGRPAYSRRISSQEYKDGQKGEWINTYENVQFPKDKDADIPDGSIVEIKGFEAVYMGKSGVGRKLVVTEYKILDTPRNTVKSGNRASEQHNTNNDTGFAQLTDDDIPF